VLTHICSNYYISSVYRSLFRELSSAGIKQEVLVPGGPGEVHKNAANYMIYDIRLNSRLARYFPVIKVVGGICKAIKRWKALKDRQGTSHVLAHTLWTDGAIACALHKIFGSPYTVVVRNTDINIFLKYGIHLRPLIWLIVSQSTTMIFVSEAHRRRVLRQYPRIYKAAKVVLVVPNGLDEEWFGVGAYQNEPRPERLVYLGRFTRIKNIHRIIKAFDSIRVGHPSSELVFVGGDRSDLEREVGEVALPPGIRCLGRINEITNIAEILRTARVLVAPSLHETFGLVYLEAISQGCAIIYTNGEGVDGLFDDQEFAIGVNCNSVEEIAAAMRALLNQNRCGIDYDRARAVVGRYMWKNIAEIYRGACVEVCIGRE
jgi:L-malate glycosyltransferase